jgi:predicted small secreted protein
MTFSLHRRFLCAALAACTALLAACTPSARSGVGGPAPDAGSTPDTRSWTAESPAGEISRWVRRECGSRFRVKQACVERTLVALIDQTGIGRTMEVLDTLVIVDGDVRFNAHALAHGLGIAAYRTPETLASTFAACPPTQMSGCYHGVVQGYFLSLARQGKLPGTPELDTMCEPHRGTTFLFFQCAHGMGHGLMAVHDNHLPMSLDACDLATDDFIRESCYGGAFMENVVRVTHPHHTAEGHAGTQGHGGHDAQPAAADAHAAHGAQPAAGHDAHGDHAHGAGQQAQAMQHTPWRPLNRNDPLYPCNAVAEKYQEACYMMQTSAILYFNGSDVSATARACEQAPAAMMSLCFGSLGRDITALTSQSHARSLELCGRAAGLGGGRGEMWCTLGVVQNLVNVAADPDEGLRFCRVVTGADAKGQCYRAVGEMISTLVNAPAQRSESCQGAEPEYVAICRSGAGIETAAGSDDE